MDDARDRRKGRWLRRGAILATVLIFSYPLVYVGLRVSGIATARVAYLNGFDRYGNWETTSQLVVEVGGRPVKEDGSPTLLTQIFAPCAFLEEFLIDPE